MGEIKNLDINETSKIHQEGFKEIKPENDFSINDAKDFLKSKIETICNKIDELAEKKVDEVAEKFEFTEKVDNYVNDVINKSEYRNTIPENPIKMDEIKKVPSSELQIEFKNCKADLKKQWEIEHKQEWPKYKTDIVNKYGEVVRKAGQDYDAHHIHPLCLGGKNETKNITPLDVFSHREIHSKDSSFSELKNHVEVYHEQK